MSDIQAIENKIEQTEKNLKASIDGNDIKFHRDLLVEQQKEKANITLLAAEQLKAKNIAAERGFLVPYHSSSPLK